MENSKWKISENYPRENAQNRTGQKWKWMR